MPTLNPNQAPSAQTGSGFTNLQRYLQANQSNQLGSTVSAGINAAGTSAADAINQAGQNFTQQVNQEQNRLSGIGSSVSNVLSGDLSKVNNQDINTFQSALSGQGQGPSGVINASDLTQKAKSAQNLGQATGSEMGRYGLLQQFVGQNSPYTLGQQGFDSLLLGQTGGNQLKSARANVVGLGQQADNVVAGAQEQGTNLQNQAKQLASNTQTQLGNVITNYDKQMQQQLANEQAQTQALIAQFNPATATNAPLTLSPEALSQLAAASNGVIKAGTNLYNTDLTPYIQANNTYANVYGAQSANDAAKIQTLSKLAGSALNGQAAGTTLQNYLTNSGDAGKYLQNQFTIPSANGLATAIQTSQTNYNNALSGTQNDMAAAVRGLVDAAPNQYSQTGGDLGNLLHSLGPSGAGPANQFFTAIGADPAAVRSNEFLTGSTYLNKIGATQDTMQAAIQQGLASGDPQSVALANKVLADYANINALNQRETSIGNQYQTFRVLQPSDGTYKGTALPASNT